MVAGIPLLKLATTVVRGEDHPGVVSDLELIEGLQQRADSTIHLFEHGIELGRRAARGAPLGLILGNRLGQRLHLKMNGIVTDLNVERPLAPRGVCDELTCPTRDALGKLGIVRIGAVARNIACLAVARVVAGRFRRSDHRFPPLAEMGAKVVGIDALQDTGNRHMFGRVEQAAELRAALPGNAHAAENTTPRWRANRCRAVSVREPYPLGGKAHNRRRVDKRVSRSLRQRGMHRRLRARPTQVVGEDQNDVGSVLLSVGRTTWIIRIR